MTENEMVGWHHQLNGHECEKTLGDTEGQEACALQSMGSQRVGYNLLTEQQQRHTDCHCRISNSKVVLNWGKVKSNVYQREF